MTRSIHSLPRRDIIFFLKKRLISKIIHITSTSEIKKYKQFNRPTVICHFKNDKMLKYQYFSEAVQNLDDAQILCGFGEDDVGEPMDTFTVYDSNGISKTYDGSRRIVHALTNKYHSYNLFFLLS